MRKVYLRWAAAISVAASCFGSTAVSVSKQDVTATQAIIRVRTDQAGYCSYRVSEGTSFTSPVNDVNPSLFSGANLDSRPGSVISGIESPNLRQFNSAREHVFVAGTRSAPMAVDGKHYSRSLQANTQHWVGVTCGSDAEVSTTFSTLNPPLGNDEPESMPFDMSSFGNVQVPSINWSDRTVTYNDPITGLQLRRMTDPGDFGFYLNGQVYPPAYQIQSATAAPQMVITVAAGFANFYGVGGQIAISGMQWSGSCSGVNTSQTITAINGSAITVNFNSSSCGTYTANSGVVNNTGFAYGLSPDGQWSTPNDATAATTTNYSTCDTSSGCTTSSKLSLVVSIYRPSTNYVYNGGWLPTAAFNDFLLRVWGSGTDANAANRTVQACLSADNQTCLGLTQTITLPQTAAGFAGTIPPSWSVQAPWNTNTATTLTNIVVSGGTATVNFAMNPGLSVNQQICVNGVRNQSVTSAQGGNGLNSCHTITATGTKSVSFPTNAAAGTYTDSELFVSSNFPVEPFASWGTPPLHSQLGQRSGTINCTAAACTTGQGASSTFDTSWPSGTKIFIAGSAPTCANDLCTVSSVTDALHLTTVENLTISGAAWLSANFGVIITKTTGTGAVSVSAGYDLVYSNTFGMGLDGSGDICNSNPVTISVDALGNPITPVTGYVCTAGVSGIGSGSTLYAFIPSTGETRLLARNWQSTISDYTNWIGWHPSQGNCWFTQRTGQSVFQVCYSGDYRALTPGFIQVTTESATPEQLTFTDIFGGAGNDMPTQIANCAANGKCPSGGINSTLFTVRPSPPQTGAAIKDKYMVMSGFAAGGGQNCPGYYAMFDVSSIPARLAWANYSWSEWPVSYGVIHADLSWGNGQYNATFINSIGIWNCNGGNFQGPFQATPTMLDKTGAGYTSNTAVNPGDGYYCPAGLDPRWQALGARPQAQGGAPACLKLKIPGDVCSTHATAAESAAYPCPWKPASNYSLIKPIAAGDQIMDGRSNGYDETFLVVQVTHNSPTDIDLLVFRYDSNSFFSTPYSTGCGQTTANITHANGWTFYAQPFEACGGAIYWINALDNTFTYTLDPIGASHADFGEGASGYTLVSGAPVFGCPAGASNNNVTCYATRPNQPLPDQIGNSFSAFPVANPVFGAPPGELPDTFLQSYPSKRQQSALAPASEMNWALDVRSFNPGAGNPAETPENLLGNTVSLVAGHTRTYLLSFPANQTPDAKNLGFVGWSGYHMLEDASGPNSAGTFGDSTPWRYCYAYAAGECTAGSAAGNMYVSIPGDTTSMQCTVNSYAYDAPCIANQYPAGFWVIQFDTAATDLNGVSSRRLTSAFVAPGRQYNFTNAKSSPDGKWVQVMASWLEGQRTDVFWVKMPPMPKRAPSDPGTTSGGTQVRLQITGASGDMVRVAFGYAENGDPANFYCTSRAEACYTSAAPSAPNPFLYAGETQAYTPCSGSCTVSLPALPGRILYYQVQRRNAQNQSLTSALGAVAVQ